MSLMPCFQPDQAFTEGAVLGRILAGYGELELTMCDCLIATKRHMNANILDLPIRDIFGKRGAEQRIKIAKKSLLAECTKANLQTELIETLEDMEWCRLIRNQYAHCHWYWTQQEGLCFVNLEELAEQPSPIVELMSNRHPIDVPLFICSRELSQLRQRRLHSSRQCVSRFEPDKYCAATIRLYFSEAVKNGATSLA